MAKKTKTAELKENPAQQESGIIAESVSIAEPTSEANNELKETKTSKCPVECLQHQKELDWLLEKVGELKPMRILEVGSFYGGTLWHWMQVSPKSKIISVDMLVSTDHPGCEKQKDGHLNLWQKWAAKNEIDLTILETSSTHPDTIEAVKKVLPEVDFLFIDGDHDYEYVKCDYLMYSPLIREGGLIAFHDIVDAPGQRGVNKFWNELKEKFKTEEITTANDRGIGIIWKTKDNIEIKKPGVILK